MSVFGVGLPEMAVIAVIGLLIFGPKKLPELGRSLGKTLKAFQSASQEFSNVVMAEASAAETPVSRPVSTTRPITSVAVAPAEPENTPGQQDGLKEGDKT